ncbi:MAG: hypothetical protein ACR2OZ_02200 [Verrucomicrobiales bacterium]
MKRKFMMQAIAALAVIWSLVWIVSQAADAAMPSTRKVLDYLRGRPLGGEARSAVIARVASDYNKLSFVDKRALRAREAGGLFEGFLSELGPEEKEWFVQRVMPPQFQQLLEGFSKLPEADRVKVLQRSKRELIEELPDSPARVLLEQADSQMLNLLAKEGLGVLYKRLPPEAKLQLLPFVEQMQNNMRRLND